MATVSSQPAANRPQPEISPPAQPMPSAIGAQPTRARATRPTVPGWASSSHVRTASRRASALRPGRRRRRAAGRPRRRARLRRVAGRAPLAEALRSRAGRRPSPPTTTPWCAWSAARVRRRRPGRRPGRRRRPAGRCRRRRCGVVLGRGVRARRRRWPIGAASGAVGRVGLRSGASGSSGSPAVQLPAGPCLVLRPVLARIGVLLGVERPVRPRRGPVPRRPAPVGLERLGLGAVVRGRAERRLVRRSLGTRRPARAGRSSAAAARAAGSGGPRVPAPPVGRARRARPP